MEKHTLPISPKRAERQPEMTWFYEHELELIDDERQRRILRLRSGLEEGKKLSYREVGERIGLKSETRIRWLQNQTMHLIARKRAEKK